MLTQFRTETAPASRTATSTEAAALASLMLEDEAVVSDAPTYSPEAVGGGLLVLGLLLSPKPPKERPTR
ncbi:hypothetical protein [Kitasatospora phosalacinea]|uniref:Uncharacterized protein n=1 Tax=Kitasatospora phosalacinea TaxID=2065 RepID=A0A9W6PEX2_9ACTN|nr:hypothetical protein [Kitasatospora phosalacinea]GLW54725.1 hypothetical protein Kpho01_27360 [Kitasatospora phosalacinea]